MRSRLVVCVLALACLLVPSWSTFGQDTTESDLLRLLRYVPDVPEVRETLVYYGDLAAWHTSWNVPRINTIDELEALDRDPHAYWMFILPRQTAPPEPLGMQYLFTDDQRAFYGFDVFGVDRFISAGAPPAQITVLDHRLDSGDITAALTASGYEAEAVPGGTLYHQFEDSEAPIMSDVEVPRVGQFGALNRIALLDASPTLLISRNTGDVLASLAAAQGEQPSLAGDPFYAAAAQAVLDPSLADTGELVGVLFMFGPVPMDPATFMLGDDMDAIREQFEQMVGDKPLPLYMLTAFATRHTPGASYLTLAVVFPPETDATAAAAILADRLQNYTSLTTGEPLTDRWTFDRASGIEVDGLPVALVTMRVDDPPPAPVDAAMPNAGVFSWYDMVLRLDLGFLAAGEWTG
ncbi:MAG: hypothetical protein OIN84_21485 [Candidatus Methanoperedens sp.]|nr:hypothetical protein [Candidatus Methanoperedens sp.]